MESIKFWKKKEKAGEILIYKLNTNNILIDNKENVNYIGPSYTSINSIKTDSEISFLYLSQIINISSLDFLMALLKYLQ